MLPFRRWFVRSAVMQAVGRLVRPDFAALCILIIGCFVVHLVVPAWWASGNRHMPWSLFELQEAILLAVIVAALVWMATRIPAALIPPKGTEIEAVSCEPQSLSQPSPLEEVEAVNEATEALAGSELTVVDGVTGLLNDRGLLERLYAEFQGSITYDLPLSVALIDLPPAWTWCDEAGLAAMDRVMEQVARLLEEQMAKTDVAARYGPDRFCVILAQTDPVTAQSRVKALCRAIENEGLLQGHSVSVGIAARSKTVSDPSALLTSALAALERYREAGRGEIEPSERGTHSDLTRARSYDAVVETWAFLSDMKDNETQGHTARVTELTVALARSVGMTHQEVVYARWGALLHDVGKTVIPESILNKPGRLTEQEFAIMQKHPAIAFQFLGRVPFLMPALDIPYCHHEKWDGTGYPRGLKGEEIPVAARLFAIVDVYDALCSDRPYRKGWEAHKVLAYVRQQAGAHFDPWAVDAFYAMMRLRIAA